MKIRAYDPQDLEDLKRICLETCEDPYLCSHSSLLYLKYLEYFVTEEPEHAFVLTDETGRAQGYILCCAKGPDFRRKWKKEYFSRLKPFGWKHVLLQRHTLLETRIMEALHYPAHMHIDISPSFQRKGGGAGLLGALLQTLKKEGIPGLYLGCGQTNVAGNAFYQKNGFKIHHHYLGRNVYVMKL